MVKKTLEMRRCKFIFIEPDDNGVLTVKEGTIDIPERLMYKNGAAKYTAEYYGIDEESIFRIESLENPREVRFEMSTAIFIRNADKKEG